MRTALFALFAMLAGCMPASRRSAAPALRLDVSCVVEPKPGAIVINCADAETWREWNETQRLR